MFRLTLGPSTLEIPCLSVISLLLHFHRVQLEEALQHLQCFAAYILFFPVKYSSLPTCILSSLKPDSGHPNSLAFFIFKESFWQSLFGFYFIFFKDRLTLKLFQPQVLSSCLRLLSAGFYQHAQITKIIFPITFTPCSSFQPETSSESSLDLHFYPCMIASAYPQQELGLPAAPFFSTSSLMAAQTSPSILFKTIPASAHFQLQSLGYVC